MKKGTILICSGPSGSGKTSLLKALSMYFPKMIISISHTTRSPRPGEKDGIDYYFINKKKFLEIVNLGGFIEYTKIFGNYYGTTTKSVLEKINNGNDIIFEINWEGAQLVKRKFTNTTSIFIVPDSIQSLRERLLSRSQDSKEVIEQRMRQVISELSHYREYDYIIINNKFKVALSEIKCIIKTMHLRAYLQADKVPVI